MEVFFAVVTGWVILVCVIYPAVLSADHRKKKAEKLELMRQFPHLAGGIFESMNEDDARLREAVRKPMDDLGQVFSAPKKKSGGGVGKFVVMALCAIYIISPIDIIPDVFPVLGWGDDVAAGLIGLRALFK